MRRYLILALAALTTCLAAIGVIGTSAMFTDDESVPFAAAASDDPIDFALDAGPENPIGATEPRIALVFDDDDWDAFPSGAGVTFDLEDLYPGEWSASHIINIRNHIWSSPADYEITAKKLSSSPDPAFWNAMEAKVERGTCEVTPPALTISNPEILYNGPLWNLFAENDDTLAAWTDSGLTGPWLDCYRFSFRLSPSAGNDLFAGSAGFEILFHATLATD